MSWEIIFGVSRCEMIIWQLCYIICFIKNGDVNNELMLHILVDSWFFKNSKQKQANNLSIKKDTSHVASNMETALDFSPYQIIKGFKEYIDIHNI